VTHVLLAIAIGLVSSQLAIVATTIYLHRAVAHKAVTYAPPVQFAFRLVVWLATGIKPRQWAAVHRRHHAFTDVAGDPHSPLLLGTWRVELTNAALYRRCAGDGETVERYARDLPPDRLDRLIFDHALVGLGTSVAGLCYFLGWQYGLLAAAVHLSSYLLINGMVNSFAHVWGRQTYVNTAHNLQWLAFLTAGEGLHNNHHAAPTSARLSHRRGELDPGWWIISLLASLRAAKVRLSEPKLVRAAQASAP
jgi:stearoyl-CoA desaturase (delta-9 desaturase)